MSQPQRRRLLVFGYLPPPYFGPSISYEALMLSEFARRFDITFVNLSVVTNIRELETIRIGKLLKLIKFVVLELWYLLTRRFDFCCYPISYNRNAFLKDALLLALARSFGVPTVLYAHAVGLPAFRQKLSKRLQRWFDRTVENAAGAIVLAEGLRAEFEGLLPSDRIFVVTHGLEPHQIPAPTTSKEGGLRILYLGGLSRAKGIFDLLVAMPYMLQGHPDARLVLAGDWRWAEEEAAGRRFVREHELDGAVQFVGPVIGEAKWKLYDSANLFVFPPHAETEAFGMVLLEALLAGLPIVATRGGARSEIVSDGVNGLLVEEQNPRDLADKILQLATDGALRQRISLANREKFATLFTHEHYGRRMIAVFETLGHAQ